MAAFKVLFFVVAVSAVVADAVFLPSLAGAAALPAIIGGKLLLIPPIIAAKAGIGLLGLKIAGLKYYRKRVVPLAALAGARAGFLATAAFMKKPTALVEGKTLAIQKMFAKLPSMPVKDVQPAKFLDFKTSFQVPAIPVPGVQWYKQPVTLDLPRIVLQQPAESTVTITKHLEPARVPKPESEPEAEKEIVNHSY